MKDFSCLIGKTVRIIAGTNRAPYDIGVLIETHSTISVEKHTVRLFNKEVVPVHQIEDLAETSAEIIERMANNWYYHLPKMAKHKVIEAAIKKGFLVDNLQDFYDLKNSIYHTSFLPKLAVVEAWQKRYNIERAIDLRMKKLVEYYESASPVPFPKPKDLSDSEENMLPIEEVGLEEKLEHTEFKQEVVFPKRKLSWFKNIFVSICSKLFSEEEIAEICSSILFDKLSEENKFKHLEQISEKLRSN